MSDTERAIEILEHNQMYMKGDPNEWAYDLAIVALRNQSEAEKKIEAVKEYCKQCPSPYFKQEDYSERIAVYTMAEEILAILEGTK